MFTIIDTLFINISLIICSVLIFYFVNLGVLAKQISPNIHLVFSNLHIQLSKKYQILMGIGFGCCSFLLSVNRIMVFKGVAIDMRYLMIFFLVMYGTRMVGSVAAVTLIILKSLHYYFFTHDPINFYINNFLMTSFVLLLSLYLARQQWARWQINLTFIIGFSLMRILTILLLEGDQHSWMFLLKGLSVYLLYFIGLFILTSYVIYKVIELSRILYEYKVSALFDQLTGFYSRDYFTAIFQHQLRRAKQHHISFSFVLIDLDNFKEINDTFGHTVGDKALQYFANALKEQLSPENQFIFRVGGDEFAILFLGQEQPTVEQTVQSFFDRLATQPLHIKKNQYFIQASGGIVHLTCSPETKTTITPDTLFNIADEALYESKVNGKSQFVIRSISQADFE